MAAAEDLRVAVLPTSLSRPGPGLLLRDIRAGDDAQVGAAVRLVAHVAPDVLVLTSFDYDLEGMALGAFADALAEAGHPMPFRFALRPNSGTRTGLDMDGDGTASGPADAQGFGYFAGDGGLAILSTLPIDADRAQDFSGVLWADLPGARLPKVNGAPFPSAEAQAIQRLSSSGHWAVPVALSDGPPLTLLVYSATPPVFDGPEDRNGLRNADETRFWSLYLDGHFGPVPESFAIIGKSNLDPVDGEGHHDAMTDLLAHPLMQDPAPRSAGGAAAADPGHAGDPALDTADWDDPPGNLRVSYILPSRDWQVMDAGVLWPAPGSPEDASLGSDVEAAGPHRLVWVDLRRE